MRAQQLTVITGYKRSTRNAYLQRLRERGFVATKGELSIATEAGVAALPEAEPLPTGEALQQFWLSRLPDGERAILKALINAHPDAVDRDDLSEMTGYKRSTRNAYLQRLRAKELIDEQGSEVAASVNLF